MRDGARGRADAALKYWPRRPLTNEACRRVSGRGIGDGGERWVAAAEDAAAHGDWAGARIGA